MKVFNKQLSYKNILLFIGITFCLLLLESYFFRGFYNVNKLIGDSGDGRFNNLVLEHWFKVFQGKQSIRDLPIFYPIQDTLGYSDMLFGFSIPYSILRIFGIDMFLANKITLMLNHLLGSIAIFYLSKYKLKFNYIISFISVLICSYANAYSVKASHTQLFFFSAVPVLIIFIFGFFENIDLNNRKRITYGALSILWIGLILCTSFYIGYFTILFSLIFILIYFFIEMKRGVHVFSNIKSFIIKKQKEVIIYIIIGIISILPFLWVYVPVINTFGRRPWSDISPMLPRWFDFINSSPLNLLWGKTIGSIFQKMIPGVYTSRPHAWELYTGFPLITFILLCTSLVYISKRFKNNIKYQVKLINKEKRVNKYRTDRFSEKINIVIFVLAISIIASFLLILNVHNFSLWWFVYKFLPGASALRAVSRYLLFLTLPVSIVISYFLNERFSQIKLNIKSITVLLCLFIILLLDNTQSGGIISAWNRNDMIKISNDVSSPPSNCETMLIIDNKGTWYNNQLDAWMIADKLNFKTINGYSGQFPKDWFSLNLNEPKNGAYIQSALIWSDTYNLKNVYSYNINTNEWIKLTIEPYQFGERLWFGNGDKTLKQFNYKCTGWSSIETWGRWTTGNNASFSIPINNVNRDMKLTFFAHAFDDNGLLISMSANSRQIGSATLLNTDNNYSFIIPKEVITGQDRLTIDYNIKNPNSPYNLKISGDKRMLGIGMIWLELD